MAAELLIEQTSVCGRAALDGRAVASSRFATVY
jgi:hypothetical protein